MRARGFTLIEMVVTLAMVGVLAAAALPLYEVTVTRQKEAELRAALRTIRSALDAYKAAVDSGQVAKGALDSGYPPSLEILVTGVEDPASRAHGPDESVDLGELERACLAEALFLEKFSSR